MGTEEISLTAMPPEKAWDSLRYYKAKYYDNNAAMYSGDHTQLRKTGMVKSFWKRPSKQKIHVPIGADIASTSSDLLFSDEMQITCVGKDEQEVDDAAQKRLEEIARENNLHALLNEGAESCSGLGDVYLKLCWSKNEAKTPAIQVVQGDCAWPEYFLGRAKAIHFFTTILRDVTESRSIVVYRAYELYTPGKIETRVYKGNDDNLGVMLDDAALSELGIEASVNTGIEEIAAVHVANIKPNRAYRESPLGRADMDGLRDLMDALDEAYSSWLRDIRLGKARLIVPAEYLRRNPADMFGPDTATRAPTFEFDEDVETLCALDIDADRTGQNAITASQFSIRSEEHAQTCTNLIREIVSAAGYSPQTFGLDIEGSAQSGTALHIREKKSFKTCSKKQAYWQDALERLLTSAVHLDAKLFPGMGSSADVHVHVRFPDLFSNDISTMSSAVEMLYRAQSASAKIRIKMLHPDWTEKQIEEELEDVKEEFGIGVTPPDASLGDFAGEMGNDKPNADEGQESGKKAQPEGAEQEEPEEDE